MLAKLISEQWFHEIYNESRKYPDEVIINGKNYGPVKVLSV